MKIDIPRVGLILFGIIIGIVAFVYAPALGARAEAFDATIVVVFSILAGIQLAIFALLGGLQPIKFQKGTSIDAGRRAVSGKRWRQLFLFYFYLIVMIAIVINQAFDLGSVAPWVERVYVSLSLTTIVWSLGLPVALSSIQADSTDGS